VVEDGKAVTAGGCELQTCQFQKKKQLGMNHTREGIGLKPAGQVEGEQ
jgi:hypothetical protein